MSDPALAPFLRGDAIILKHPSGAVVKDGHSSYLVRGDGAYNWLSSMVGLLDGSRTLGELLDVFPEELRKTAAGLIDALATQETVRWLSRPSEPGRQLDDLEAFLANWTEDPVGTAQSFRTARIEVVGEGLDVVALVRTLRDNGATGVVTVAADEVRGPWVVAASSVTEEDLLGIAGRAEAGELTLLPLVALDDALILGPFIGSGYPCSLRDVLSAVRRNTEPTHVGRAPVSASAPLDLMGVHVAFELFREIAGVLPSQLSERVCVMDVPSLDMHLEQPVLPFSTAGATTPTPSGPETPASVQGPVLDSLMALMAPRTGLVSRVEDLDLPQEPLFLAAFSHAWSGSRRSVGHSRESLAAARCEALLDAVAQAAASAVSPAGGSVSVAAGVDADDAARRAGWAQASRVLTGRVLASDSAVAVVPLPADPLSDVVVRFMTSRDLTVRLRARPDVSDRLVLGAATDPTGEVVAWAAQAAPTLDDAASRVLDSLAASVQVGTAGGAGDLPPGLGEVLRGSAQELRGAGADDTVQEPVTWEEAIGLTSARTRVVDITPAGLVPLTAVRVCSVSTEPGSGSDD